MKKLIIAMIIISALFSGCITERKSEIQNNGAEITERYWKLIELNGRVISTAENMNNEPHLILKEADNRVTGSGGCNIFNGSYSISDGFKISFSKMMTTMMACPELDTEMEFLKILERCDNYSINNDVLSLNKARMAPLARFKAMEK